MDIKLNYIEKGKGKPLIMIHGNEESCVYFKGQFEYFADKGFRCIAPDSRAHGDTPRGTAPLTIRQMTDDIMNFMDELGIGKADFIGFSDGGNIMLIMAMNHPERIGRMVIDGANLSLDGAADWAIDWVMGEYNNAKEKADEDPEAKLKMEIMGLMVNDPDIDPEELTKIDVPTLVMAGEEDLILKEHTELIASKIPGAQLAFCKGDHFCAREFPDEFNAIAGPFLVD